MVVDIGMYTAAQLQGNYILTVPDNTDATCVGSLSLYEFGKTCQQGSGTQRCLLVEGAVTQIHHQTDISPVEHNTLLSVCFRTC